MTEGAAGQYTIDGETLLSAVTYPKVLSELSGREVVNKGIGGQNATQIAVRQGGVTLNTTSELTIPAETTPVEVELTTSNGISIVNNPYGMSLSSCYISDIHGKLECKDNKFYFTRTEAGKAYKVPVGTQIVSADSLEYNDGIAVIWIGTNGGWVKQDSDWFDFNAYTEICDGMISKLETQEYVIVGLTTQGSAERSSMEKILSEKYGDRFINLRECLTVDEALYEKYGVTLTEEDKASMSEGIVPSTIIHDGPHFYSVGYRMIGDIIYKHMQKIGILK